MIVRCIKFCNPRRISPRSTLVQHRRKATSFAKILRHREKCAAIKFRRKAPLFASTYPCTPSAKIKAYHPKCEEPRRRHITFCLYNLAAGEYGIRSLLRYGITQSVHRLSHGITRSVYKQRRFYGNFKYCN